MVYLLVIPVLVYSVFIIYRFRKIKKHDTVLFDFCEIRRDIMRLLRVKGFELTRDDYQVIRHVYNVLDSAIHNYNDYKSSIFNIRSFYKLAKKYNESTSEIEKIKIPNNAEIQKIYTNFNYTMIKAFFTFTPLLKSELFIRVLIYFLSVLSRFGKNYLTNRIKFIIEFFNNFEKQKNTYGFAG